MRHSLKEVKAITYHKTRQPWWAVLVLDPVTAWLVWLVQEWRFVTPNRLTWLSFLIGIPGIVCFALGEKGYLFIVLGVISFQFSLLVDYADGKLARLRQCTTKSGDILDRTLDSIEIVFFMLALIYCGYSISGSNIYLLAGFLWFAPFTLRYLSRYYALTMGVDTRVKLTDVSVTINSRSRLIAKLESFTERRRVYPFPADNDIYVIVFGIAPLIGHILIGIYIAATYSWVMFIADSVLLLAKTKEVDDSE